MTSAPRRVRSSDDVGLAVHELGRGDRPTLVLVHGYPDNHSVWDGVADLLADDFHVVAYDVRGTGESDKPGARSAYRIAQLVADLRAVMDAASPNRPVHLVGHDWGSIQLWAAVTDADLAPRIASFTSISGPSLDYAGAWTRRGLTHPGATLRQLAHSYYIGLFQVPGLAELAVRTGVLDRSIRLSGRGTRSAAAVEDDAGRPREDEINGISLYRANAHTLLRPRPRPTPVPVQVIAPEHDAFVTPEVAVQSPRPWAQRLTTRVVAGGHWVVRERPDVIARLVREFVTSIETPPEAAEPARPSTRGDYAAKLVLVTGGGRGIGRATALEFARRGADILIADIDDVAAKDTIGEVQALGVRAWARHLDVSRRDEWESFAASTRAELGVPDAIVNNAGIGMGGPFLGTSVDDWAKIIDVNVWSVIHGSRLFAAQMVERGEGGQIINVASAAAYSPSVVYPAYATSKAAVLMLTDCLRAELAPEGIGVTAVCPGFIDTDISRTTIHVGVDAAEADRLRRHQVASYRRRGYSPEKVATQVVRAAAKRRPMAVITPEAKVLRAVSRFAPRLGRRIARLDLNKL